eukprot:10348314-Prorocentrum_lima.AAC.1
MGSFVRQKSLNPNSSPSAPTDNHRVVWLCPTEAVKRGCEKHGGCGIERGVVWKRRFAHPPLRPQG